MLRARLSGGIALAFFALAAPVSAQEAAPAPPSSSTSPPADASGAITLPPVTVTAAPGIAPRQELDFSPQIEKFALPQTVESIGQQKIEETTNSVDTEDAIKYLPSLFVRKRNYGDTQPTLATRTWGVNSSARSLVYVDDVPISALISNNNTTGAPRWGMVAPGQISGIDMLYGPFAAEYPGNSMGGVLLITTRMPEGYEATAKETGAFQIFDLYKTSGTYATSNSAATIGDKVGKLSWFLSANREDSYSQPLIFVTSAATPAGTSGTIPALSKVGAAANVVGAGGLLHTVMDNLTGKAALDLTDWLKATYTIGYWDDDTHSAVQSYLRDAQGNPTFGGVSGFASNTYKLQEQHLMNALSLKTDTRGDWDWEAVATRYDYLQSVQRTPAGVLAGSGLRTDGSIARMDGTGWSTLDLKGIWRPSGPGGAHEVSFGAHRDRYVLNNPTFATTNWVASPDSGNGAITTDGRGKTETYALWVQDAWKFAPGLRLTLGGRGESWRAYDGLNIAGTVAAVQPTVRAANFSPKASLSWEVTQDWTTSLSFGQAHRYPTVAELYQIVSTGAVFAVPNPSLTPESVRSWELAVVRQVEDTRLRISLFQEDTTDALVQQANLINNSFVSTWQNVGRTRNRGVEFVVQRKDALISGLDLSNSVTYVDSRILSDPGFASATGTTATGKHVPYVPDWRDTAQAAYRANERLTLALAARYSGTMYSTLDNTDSVSHVTGAFDRFFVVDTHVHYQVTDALSADVGIDNLLDQKYFEFHPFPGRTYVASLKLKL